jgi:3-mercaptopyruvate sulfurtransferase SseA
MTLKRTLPAMIVLILATLACQTLFPQADSTTPAPLPTQPGLGQSSPGNPPPLTEDEVPRISVSEAKAALDSGQAVFVDTRDAEYFIQGHIKGAVSIPLDRFENSLAGISLEENQWIITYCT